MGARSLILDAPDCAGTLAMSAVVDVARMGVGARFGVALGAALVNSDSDGLAAAPET